MFSKNYSAAVVMFVWQQFQPLIWLPGYLTKNANSYKRAVDIFRSSQLIREQVHGCQVDYIRQILKFFYNQPDNFQPPSRRDLHNPDWHFPISLMQFENMILWTWNLWALFRIYSQYFQSLLMQSLSKLCS